MLSAMPPLAVATGIALSRLTPGRALRFTGWLFALLALGGIGAVAYARLPDYLHFAPGALPGFMVLAIAVLFLLSAAALGGQARLFAAGSAVGVVALFVTAICLIVPAFGPVNSLRIAGDRIHEQIRAGDRLINVGSSRTGLLWYADHPVEDIDGRHTLPKIWRCGKRVFLHGRKNKLSRIYGAPDLRYWTLWEHPRGTYVVITNFPPE